MRPAPALLRRVVPRRFHGPLRRLRFRLHHRGLSRTFERINAENYWADEESASGPGSSREQTAVLVRELPAMLASISASSVLDIPCGDFAWMSRVDLSGLGYIGGDLVPGLVEQNARLHGSERVRFEVLDLTVDRLPVVDVVLVRDCLVHLSNALVWAALDGIRSSGCRHLLATTYVDRTDNRNGATGRWRPINLEAPPFHFPAASAVLLEGCTEHAGSRADKALGLWSVDDIPPTPRRFTVHPMFVRSRILRLARLVRSRRSER